MKTQFLETAGGTIAYDVHGEGALLVCVPGMGDLRAEYRFAAPLLASEGYRVATMDVRGHGESGTGWDDYSVAGIGADILALIRALDGGPALVVGTSMAAGAAVWAAAEQPASVAGIALVGPFVSGEAGALQRLIYGLLIRHPWGVPFWKEFYASLYPSRKPQDFEAYSQALVRNLKENGRLEALRAMMLASKSAAEARLSRVKAPALVLMGERDPDFKDPHAHAMHVAASLNAHTGMIPHAGHYPHAEQPEAFVQALLPFVQEVFVGG